MQYAGHFLVVQARLACAAEVADAGARPAAPFSLLAFAEVSMKMASSNLSSLGMGNSRETNIGR